MSAASRKRPRGPSAAEWNRKYPVGTRVRYTDGTGQAFESRTRSHAWSLGGGDPVVLIDGKTGGRALWALEVL